MGDIMPKGGNSDSSISLAKGSHGKYVVQDMKNCEKKQVDIKLVMKPEKEKNQEGQDDWYTPDFMKIEFKK
jgi:hypothetical protein